MKFLIISRKGRTFKVTESKLDNSGMSGYSTATVVPTTTPVEQLEKDLNDLASDTQVVIQQVLQVTED